MKNWIVAMVMLGTPVVVLAQASAPANAPAKKAEMPAPKTSAGMASSNASMTAMESKARGELTAAGYTNIKDLKQTATGWDATATHQGKESKVHLSSTGTVTPAGMAK